MPTFFEPTNIPQLEAFALGCPVITSNIYGKPEQVGEAALLVNPHNPQEIADKISALWLDNEKQKFLVAEGYKMNERYSSHVFSAKLSAIINSILE